ncbi:MAG TPA: glycosyltransferase family A protein [Azospirillaceae bacterium]|nr:glycosyltransferase family A protein [Azospirillaceae bacterium]
MQTPLVSVLIPAYNAARFIAAAVQSAQAQTLRDIEIVVVDDGSQDATAAIVAELADKDPRIRLLRQRNMGVSAARNKGLKAARAPYVAPLDADDLWRHDKLERQLAAANAPEVGLVYTWSTHVDEDSRVIPGRATGSTHEGWVYPHLLMGNFVGSGSVPLMRREALLAAGGWDEDMRGNEDQLLYLRIAEKWRFAVVRDVLVGYRQRAGSLSRNRAMMLRCHEAMLEDARSRHPELPEWIFRWARANYAWYLAFQAGRAGVRTEALSHVARMLTNDPLFVLRPAVRDGVKAGVRTLVRRALARPKAREAPARVDFHSLAPHLAEQVGSTRGPVEVWRDRQVGRLRIGLRSPQGRRLQA